MVHLCNLLKDRELCALSLSCRLTHHIISNDTTLWRNRYMHKWVSSRCPVPFRVMRPSSSSLHLSDGGVRRYDYLNPNQWKKRYAERKNTQKRWRCQLPVSSFTLEGHSSPIHSLVWQSDPPNIPTYKSSKGILPALDEGGRGELIVSGSLEGVFLWEASNGLYQETFEMDYLST